MSLQNRIKPRIKIDVDNVLNNMTETMIAIYNARHGTDYVLEDCKQYDFASFDGAMRDELFGMLSQQELYDKMRPARHAAQYLFLLMHEFDVKIVTATCPDNVPLKMGWLRKWFPYVKDSDVIIASDKKWIDADYAIDDHLGNLLHDLADRILIDAPWNRRVIDYAYSIRRVSDLKDAYQIITTIEKELEKEYEDSF